MATTNPKGSKNNPYTMSEYESLADAGNWEGGYVQDDSGKVTYIMKEITVTGYSCGSSGSGSGSGSFQFASYTSFSGDPSLEEDDNDDEYGNGGGSGGSGNSGGNGGGNGTGSGGGSGNSGGGNTNLQITLGGKYSSLSTYTQLLMRNLKGYTGMIYITSTARTPEKQAEIMLTNIKTLQWKRKKDYMLRRVIR